MEKFSKERNVVFERPPFLIYLYRYFSLRAFKVDFEYQLSWNLQDPLSDSAFEIICTQSFEPTKCDYISWVINCSRTFLDSWIKETFKFPLQHVIALMMCFWNVAVFPFTCHKPRIEIRIQFFDKIPFLRSNMSFPFLFRVSRRPTFEVCVAWRRALSARWVKY